MIYWIQASAATTYIFPMSPLALLNVFRMQNLDTMLLCWITNWSWTAWKVGDCAILHSLAFILNFGKLTILIWIVRLGCCVYSRYTQKNEEVKRCKLDWQYGKTLQQGPREWFLIPSQKAPECPESFYNFSMCTVLLQWQQCNLFLLVKCGQGRGEKTLFNYMFTTWTCSTSCF